MANLTYEQCLDTIYRLSRFGIKLELDTIQNILKFLNNPHKNYKILHVAGTNGKGSTATYISSILRQAGFKTGVYTSPHLVRFNERITVDGKEISNQDVIRSYEAVNAVDIGKRRATFFEIATAMAFYHFSKQNVDWAVIETGMGGRFDATNIVQPQASVITNLSIEHTEYLGSTIADLAREKGGIIKSKAPVVTAVSQPSAMKVLQKIAEEKEAPLFRFKKEFSLRKTPNQNTYTFQGIYQTYNKLVKPLPGDHQRENLSLALAACELIFTANADKDKRYSLTPDIVREGLSKARWPGRLEKIMEAPLVILDGAHNLKAAQLLGKYLAARLDEKKLTLVVGILDDKPYEEMLAHLVPLAHRVIITKAKIDRSLDTEILKLAVEKNFTGEIRIIEDVKEAVSHAISTSSKNDAVCIAGSLYVAGEAKEKFNLDFIL